jgi:hypothetical protein
MKMDPFFFSHRALPRQRDYTNISGIPNSVVFDIAKQYDKMVAQRVKQMLDLAYKRELSLYFTSAIKYSILTMSWIISRRDSQTSRVQRWAFQVRLPHQPRTPVRKDQRGRRPLSHA